MQETMNQTAITFYQLHIAESKCRAIWNHLVQATLRHNECVSLPCSLFKVCLKKGETAVQWACKLSIFRGCSNCLETAGIRLHSNYSAGTKSAGTHLFIFVLHTRSLLSLSEPFSCTSTRSLTWKYPWFSSLGICFISQNCIGAAPTEKF